MSVIICFRGILTNSFAHLVRIVPNCIKIIFIAYLFLGGNIMPDSEFFDRGQNYDFERRLENRFKDEKLNYYRSFYYTNLETTLIKVNLERAVIEYAESFKSFFNIEQTLNNNDYIIDLSNALFIDSTFLGAIIYSIKLANSRGADLCIIVDLNKVKILSHLKNLSSVMKIYPSVEEAMKQLKKTEPELQEINHLD
jgi:anti-anti-sigma factor